MASDGVIYPREALRMLKEIVEETGADTERNCVYVEQTNRDGSMQFVPHCIVGVFFNRLGWTPEELSDWDGMNIRDIVTAAERGSDPEFSRQFEEHGVKIDSGALKVLQTAQSAQDVGQTWGEALDAVDAEVFGDLERYGSYV